MTLSPGNNQQGNAELGISTAGVSTTRNVAKMRNAANSADLDWPDTYIEASSFKVRVTTTDTTAHQVAQWILAVVEDAFDNGGNYTDAAGTALATGVLAVIELGDLAAGTHDIVLGDGSGTNGATINTSFSGKGFGTFRIVLGAGNNVLNAKRVASATAAGAFHEDSDGYTASGTGDLVAVNGARIVGTGGIKCKLTAASRTAGNWGYPDQITASFTLKGVIDGTSNPFNRTGAPLANLRVAWSTVVDPNGAQSIKETSDTISSAGVVDIPATNIDTAWGQVVGGTDFYTQLANGQNFGDVSTPANEKASIYAIGTTNAPDNEQMAYVFQTGAVHVSPFVVSSDANRRLRTTTADQKASAAIQSAIASYRETGRTNPQNLFKRTGQVNTTNAIPFLRGIFTDAYSVALVNATTLILSTRTDAGAGDVQENSQTLDVAGGAGGIDWSYTIANNHAAFNRFIKSAATRVTGSHAATGPDSISSPPATFNVPGASAQYTGPFPAYPKDVRVTGNEFAGVNEPSVRQTGVFGVNSEIIFEDIWTGSLANVALDGNGVPNGPGNRNFVIPNSAKCKTTTEINEGSVRVTNLSEANPKDVAGIPTDLSGAEFLEGRRALWDITAGALIDAGTNLGTAIRLDTPLGYAAGTNSLDTIGAPSDPSSFAYYQAWKDTVQGNEATEDASGFLLTTDITNVGFQTDTGNFGYFRQSVAWVNPDLSLSLKLTPRVVQSDPSLTVRHGIKVFRVTADAYLTPATGFVDVHPDEAPIYVVYGLNADGSQTQISQGSSTPLGTPSTTADYYFDVVVSSAYFAISVFVSARVSGSPVAGGSQSFLQVGYTFDAVAFATGLPFK